MDDDYELVSKDILKKLKEENAKLKEQVERKEDKKENNITKELIKEVQVESKKERDLIFKELNDIKEINKSTLNNVLLKTEYLDHKLETLVETLESMTGSLRDIVDGMSNNDEDKREFIDGINEHLDESYNKELSDIHLKLDKVEDFMEKLKLLLSQVKPNDLTLENKN